MDLSVCLNSRAEHTDITDLLKSMLDNRKPEVSKACRAWKLLIYYQNICARHQKGRKGKFKSITLSFFAVAILDQVFQLRPNTSAAVALQEIANAFLTFEFEKDKITVHTDGSTEVVAKTDACGDDVISWLDVQGTKICCQRSTCSCATMPEQLEPSGCFTTFA